LRHAIDDPSEIEFVPVSFGNMNPEQIRTHALTTTPDTLEWDCFTGSSGIRVRRSVG
jgi:mycolipenoyl-CoA---2-(long-chain-fatty acyl)-trehalose mycolipenoyltransferase / long-chain-acyl-CoA---trehalose acyltransferase